MNGDQWPEISDSAKQLFVVVRFDEPTGAADWKQAIKVLKVFTNGESAEREAERLRSINGPDKCVYEVHAAQRWKIEH